MLTEAVQRSLLRAIFEAGVAAVQAEAGLPGHLPLDRPPGRTALLALGKAAGHMARVALDRLPVDEALIVTRRGHMPAGWTPPACARVIEAGHPNPDAASLLAGETAIALAESLGQGDRLIALISGGGSALMAAPVRGISFPEKQAINRALLASGAPIAEMNQVRAAMSRVKGGRLVELAHPAQVLTFVMSDVPGDNPALVASGPTCAFPDSADPVTILARWGIAVPDRVANAMRRDRPALRKDDQAVVVARPADALAAMARQAETAGFRPVLLGDAIEGDAVVIAQAHASLAIAFHDAGQRVAIISGGETSVQVTAPSGIGGRNLTYALALAIALEGKAGIFGLAADSDGIDGTSDVAGAMIFPTTLHRTVQLQLRPAQCLRDQNSADLFARLGDAVVTGPTGTNVNDLRALLVDPA